MSENSSATGTPIQLDQYRARVGDQGLTDVQEEICRRVMNGESIRKICETDGLPSRATVFNMLAQDEGFRQAYSLAKILLAEQLAEEILEISDDSSADYVESEKGRELDREHVQRSQLRVASRKWLAAKLAPKRYGDASTITLNDTQAPKREYSRTEMFARLAKSIEDNRKRGLLPDLSEGED